MKRAIIISVLIIVNVFSSINLYSNDALDINKLKGEKKWIELRNYLIKVREWICLPGSEYELLPNGKFIEYVYTVKERFAIVGEWKVNEKKQYFYLKSKKLYGKGFVEEYYRNFIIECNEYEGERTCQILFLKDKMIPKDKDITVFNADLVLVSKMVKK